MEAGLLVFVAALIRGSSLALAGAVLIVGGFASFAAQIRRTAKRRLPRPPALPARDWSTWQTHAALLWLLIAARWVWRRVQGFQPICASRSAGSTAWQG